MTTTITMTGYSTGYGSTSGSDAFNLTGYFNTVLLQGAADSVAIAGGGRDSIDLNANGFGWGTTDSIALGASNFDTISASHALDYSALSITGGGGEISVDLVNHGGTTAIAIGNAGNVPNHAGLGQDDVVTLNGDASNSVSFTGGNGASVTIGSAADGLTGYASSVAFTGVYNSLTGGDENFTVSAAGGLSAIALGNGNDSLALAAGGNSLSLGNGNDEVSIAGYSNKVALGTGNDTLTTTQGGLTLSLATGGAGANDSLTLAGGLNVIHGGDENVSAAIKGSAAIFLGNGNDSITLGGGHVVLGSTAANTATDSLQVNAGATSVILNGGVDTVTLSDKHLGYDTVTLNGCDLGTTLTAGGSFDKLTLTNGASAAITEDAGQQGLALVVNGTGAGVGDIAVTGLAQDALASIDLVGCGTYTVSVDQTAQGGLTLHFAHGSIDLIGLQSLSNSLISSS